MNVTPTHLADQVAQPPEFEAAQLAESLAHLTVPRIRIVLPAFNEELALPPLLRGIASTMLHANLDYQIIVVDDGSSDGTASVAKEYAVDLPLTLVQHEQNSGLGKTLNTGIRAALRISRPEDIIITMDADNSHPPHTIHRLVSRIREGCDVAIASRFHVDARTAGVPWDRKWLSILASWVFKSLQPIQGVRDYTCGYRAYRVQTLMAAVDQYGDHFISETGFSCMVDVLLKLRRLSLVMGEVPLVLRYDQKLGASKMRVLRTIRQTLGLVVRRMAGS